MVVVIMVIVLIIVFIAPRASAGLPGLGETVRFLSSLADGAPIYRYAILLLLLLIIIIIIVIIITTWRFPL